jgi:hypothetical protein
MTEEVDHPTVQASKNQKVLKEKEIFPGLMKKEVKAVEVMIDQKEPMVPELKENQFQVVPQKGDLKEEAEKTDQEEHFQVVAIENPMQEVLQTEEAKEEKDQREVSVQIENHTAVLQIGDQKGEAEKTDHEKHFQVVAIENPMQEVLQKEEAKVATGKTDQREVSAQIENHIAVLQIGDQKEEAEKTDHEEHFQVVPIENHMQEVLQTEEVKEETDQPEVLTRIESHMVVLQTEDQKVEVEKMQVDHRKEEQKAEAETREEGGQKEVTDAAHLQNQDIQTIKNLQDQEVLATENHQIDFQPKASQERRANLLKELAEKE